MTLGASDMEGGMDWNQENRELKSEYFDSLGFSHLIREKLVDIKSNDILTQQSTYCVGRKMMSKLMVLQGHLH